MRYGVALLCFSYIEGQAYKKERARAAVATRAKL